MKTLKIISRSTADTDYTIAYIDGKPVAIAEESDGGYYATLADGEYIQNTHEQQYWYVDAGKWETTHIDHNALINIMDGYAARTISDGSQIVYNGDLIDLSDIPELTNKDFDNAITRMMKTKYAIYTRVDESGSITESTQGLLKGKTNDFNEAQKIADIPGGYIVRNADGYVRAPDGTWIGK